jgi:hypothetical protein
MAMIFPLASQDIVTQAASFGQQAKPRDLHSSEMSMAPSRLKKPNPFGESGVQLATTSA